MVSIPNKSWDKVAIDFAGPFQLPEADYKFLVVLSDYYSKWIYFDFMETIDTSSVIAFLEKCFNIKGFPCTRVSDNGKQLTSEKMVSFLNNCGIIQERTPFYSPKSNGQWKE